MHFIKSKAFILFICLFIHVFLLNLVYVSHYGVQFYWQENTTVESITLHFLTAFLAAIFYVAISGIRKIKEAKFSLISDKIWVILSLILAGLIGFMMI